jgi:excisionase family DNA binding protein
MTPDELEELARRVVEVLKPHLEAELAKPSRLGWSPAEVAQLLGIDKATAYRWIDGGVIPAARLGGRLIVSDAALRRLLETDTKARGAA